MQSRNIFRFCSIIERNLNVKFGKLTASSYEAAAGNCRKYYAYRTVCRFHRNILPITSLAINKPFKGNLQACCKFGQNVQDENKSNLSLYQRFKIMYKEYWYVLVPVHIITSSFWFGGFYYLAVSGVDIVNLLEVIGTPDSWTEKLRGSKASGLVTAYTMYKLATPARYTVTLGGTTVSITYLKRWGWIKPMPSRKELQDMYEDKKSSLKEKMSVTKEEIKDEFIKTRDDITQHMKEAKTGFQKSVIDTKDEFKEGVRVAADEWKHIGKLVKQRSQEFVRDSKEK